MENTSIQALLQSDGERVQYALKAGDSVERDREQSLKLLDEELSSLLLRYNAACAPDRMRQALADCLAATARETLALLRAAGAETVQGRRESSGWAVLLLLLAVAAGAAGGLLAGSARLAGVLCAAGAVILAFLAGRLWFRPRSVTARPTLDPEALWRGLQRTGETMDRKIEAFCQRAADWAPLPAHSAEGPGEEELRLYGELLEALYAQNGDYALRQLEKLRPCLRAMGLETADYTGDNAALFELLPSKRPGQTLRPALLMGERLLLPGRATEQTD